MMPFEPTPFAMPSRPEEFSTIVQQSRRRSARLVPPRVPGAPPRVWSERAAARHLRAHQLNDEIALLHDLLGPTAHRNGLVLVVADADGRILDLSGGAHSLRRAVATGMTPGADWSEGALGTNGIGTAASIGRPVRVVGPEHFASWARSLTCWAAPIRHPSTGRITGVVNLSAWPDSAQSSTDAELSLLLAATFAVELRLYHRATIGLPGPARAGQVTEPGYGATSTPVSASGELRVLGRHRAEVRTTGRSIGLSLRHSELALLLSWQPAGRSAAQLASVLYEVHEDPGFVRAEVRRLRQVLTSADGWDIGSRPYAFGRPPRSDAAAVMAHLERGEVDRAVDAYPGPVLPQAGAPGVIEIRREVHSRLRAAVLQDADPERTYAFARIPANADDVELWDACRRRLPRSSPLRVPVSSQLAYIDSVFAR